MISAIVGLIASFLVGALIAWVTREKERRAEAVEAREEELAPREPSAPLPSELGDDDDADAAAAVASAEEPVYAPYDVGGSPRFSVLAEDFVAAPPSLPEALSAPPSAPSSPRANHVVWEPDDARDSCNFCLVRFTAIRRRHHCRSCGLLVCNNCSRDRQKVPGAGVLPVRVCDACKISSIASKKGETVHIQSIRAFALHNSSAKLGGSVSRPSSPMEVVAVAPVVESDVKKLDDDEELLQMSRALYADLSQSFLSDKGMSDVDKEEEGRSVRRALFPDETAEEVTAAENGVSAIPAKFRAEEKLREAEALMNAPGWTTVLERDGVTVRRVAVSPVDAFCVQTRVKGNARKIGKNLLNLETRLKWDDDLDPSGTREVERFGNAGSLQVHLSKQVGPVSARSFVVLNVRCDEGSTVRLLQAGYEEEPSLHSPKGTAGAQLPQLLLLQQLDDTFLLMTQHVHLTLGGWLPASVAAAGMPNLLVKSTLSWKKFVEEEADT